MKQKLMNEEKQLSNMRSHNAKKQACIEDVMKKKQTITIPDLPKSESASNCDY